MWTVLNMLIYKWINSKRTVRDGVKDRREVQYFDNTFSFYRDNIQFMISVNKIVWEQMVLKYNVIMSARIKGGAAWDDLRNCVAELIRANSAVFIFAQITLMFIAYRRHGEI